MSIITGSFTASEQASPLRTVTIGRRLIVSVFGSWTGVVRVMRSVGGVETQVAALTENGNYQYVADLEAGYKLHAATVSTGTIGWRLEEANECVLLGNLEWDDLRFPAQGINPAGAVAAPAVDTTEAAFPGTLLFDNATPELVCGVAQMPHEWVEGTNLRPHVHWMKTTSAVGNVVWHLYYRVINRGVASEAWVGPVVGETELSTGDVADVEGITTFGDLPMPYLVTSKMLAWRLYRKADDAADTYGADARMLELDFHYQKNSLGSGAEFFK
jgi:hypothetical protein